jgi:aspartyl-tRNA(Asn)/glutamyl-tRNA(Gln) amidotransferase subunit A
MDIFQRSLDELSDAIRTKQLPAESCVEHFARIHRTREPAVSAFITPDYDAALAAVRSSGAVDGPLTGIPIAVKDGICTCDLRTTAGSLILEHFVPPYDATVVRKLRAAGAAVVGKTNMDEFAMGSSTENSAFGCSRNPWNTRRVPGGSSGGSAAAVATGMVPMALGSDTGGSIRQPASFCGITGLKPTYGRVSRFGLIAFASSLDQVGPMTRTAQDAAVVLRVIAGHDPQDSTSARRPVPDYVDAITQPIDGLRMGICREHFDPGLDSDVGAAVMSAVDELQSQGAMIQEVSLPHSKFAIPAYYVLAPCEASSNLARYDGVRYTSRTAADELESMYSQTRGRLFGAEVRRRVLLGTYALSSGYYDEYYLTASRVRRLIKRDYDLVFDQVDLIIGPTTPTVAFPIGERIDDPVRMYLADIYTVAANLAGLPAISIPCGLSNGMPVGLQLQGRAYDEETLLRVAHQFQMRTDWHLRRPA